ncbi:MAG: hydrolase [Tetragenococcus koreensis]|nr:hydrolase [Tetragenococcus koreensis]
METLSLTFLFVSMVVLLITPYLKSGITLAIISLASYYYFAAIDSWAAILLLVVGLVLVIFEIFIPDFGLLGIFGFVSIVLGLYLTTGEIEKTAVDLIVALSSSTLLFIILFKQGYSFTNWNKFVLNTQNKNEEKVESVDEKQELTAGMVGKSKTALRPSGKALFENKKMTYDVISDDGHIRNHEEIVIQKIIGNKIIVRKK